jgi:hypothetical protein
MVSSSMLEGHGEGAIKLLEMEGRVAKQVKDQRG